MLFINVYAVPVKVKKDILCGILKFAKAKKNQQKMVHHE